MPILFALLFGIVAGLRVFTGLGLWAVLDGSGIWRILLPIAALGEYVGDASPKIPPRTALFPSVIARVCAGGFGAWLVVGPMGASLTAIIFGAIGALMGTYGGYNLRMRLIDAFGAIPAAIAEDAIAIALATIVVLNAK